MAKSRRKSSGCKAGTFKVKRMGKGWTAHKSASTPVKVRTKAQREALEADESNKKD